MSARILKALLVCFVFCPALVSAQEDGGVAGLAAQAAAQAKAVQMMQQDIARAEVLLSRGAVNEAAIIVGRYAEVRDNLTLATLRNRIAVQKTELLFTLQRIKAEFEDGNFGETVRLLHVLREHFGALADANFWHARVYEVQGELGLAEKFYRETIRQASLLEAADDRFVAAYRLANLLKVQKKYRDYEVILQDIVRQDHVFSNPDSVADKDQMLRVLRERGLDRLLMLYRREPLFSLEAHSQLGSFYVKTGRYDQAIQHLLNFNLSLWSTVITEIRKKQYDFEFQSMERCLSQIENMRMDYLKDYLKEARWDENLYFLAAAMYGAGPVFHRESRKIWNLLTMKANGTYAAKSQTMLRNPSREPLIQLF